MDSCCLICDNLAQSCKNPALLIQKTPGSSKTQTLLMLSSTLACPGFSKLSFQLAFCAILSFILVRKWWRDSTAYSIRTDHDISAYELIILPHLCFIMELDWDTNPHNSSSLSVYCNAGVSIASFQISWVIYKKEQLRRCCWNITPQGGKFHLVSITLMG